MNVSVDAMKFVEEDDKMRASICANLIRQNTRISILKKLANAWQKKSNAPLV